MGNAEHAALSPGAETRSCAGMEAVLASGGDPTHPHKVFLLMVLSSLCTRRTYFSPWNSTVLLPLQVGKTGFFGGSVLNRITIKS